MNCPQCGTAVADGTAICPKCDYILDPSFLDEGPAPARKPTGARPAVERPSGRNPLSSPKAMGVRAAASPGGAPARTTGSRPAARPSTRSAVGSASTSASADPPDGATQIKNLEEIERPTRPPRSTPPRRAPAARDDEDEVPLDRSSAPIHDELSSDPGIDRTYSGIAAPEEVLYDVKNFVRGLPTSDKLAFYGAVLTVFLTFMPWKETAAEGEILGFVSLGFAAFLANVLTIATIVVRVRNSMPQLNPVVPWLAQLGSVCFGFVWSLIFIKVSTDGRPVPALIGSEVVALSRPSFGVYLSILTQLVSLAGTLMGLKEKPA